jgi:hypothetical protein
MLARFNRELAISRLDPITDAMNSTGWHALAAWVPFGWRRSGAI